MYLLQPPLIPGENVLLQCSQQDCGHIEEWDPDQLAMMHHDCMRPVCANCGYADDLPPGARVPCGGQDGPAEIEIEPGRRQAAA